MDRDSVSLGPVENSSGWSCWCEPLKRRYMVHNLDTQENAKDAIQEAFVGGLRKEFDEKIPAMKKMVEYEVQAVRRESEIQLTAIKEMVVDEVQ